MTANELERGARRLADGGYSPEGPTPTRVLLNEIVREFGAGRSVSTPAYVELGQPCEGLAIVGLGVRRVYGADVVAPAMNRTAILDFEVTNVDREFERLKDIVKDWVFSPTNQPWGNRAMLFRDPDGNLVNVFTTAREVAGAPQ
jgi:hypothetical protein